MAILFGRHLALTSYSAALLLALSVVHYKMHSAHTGYFTFGSQNEHAGLTSLRKERLYAN